MYIFATWRIFGLKTEQIYLAKLKKHVLKEDNFYCIFLKKFN